METKQTMTRRSAAGLLLAVAALPTAKAFGAAERFVRIRPLVNPTLAVLTSFSGESFTAAFASDLRIGSAGSARGFMRFALGDRIIADYVAQRGGLDFDEAGDPIRAWVALLARGSSGQVAQDFALVSVTPEANASEDCLIYTTVGPDVNPEPVRFDVPGAWVEVR